MPLDLSDGAQMPEAVILARQEFLKSPYRSEYYPKNPEVLHDLSVRDYPAYWFVSFLPKKFDQSFWRYLVVIEKDSGQIIYANPYVPLEVVDYDWVFKKK